MSTQPSLFDQVRKHRSNKRTQIQEYFMLNRGVKIDTVTLHLEFGTSFRTRVSELNRDPQAPITILNHTEFVPKLGKETSVYWSEIRQ